MSARKGGYPFGYADDTNRELRIALADAWQEADDRWQAIAALPTWKQHGTDVKNARRRLEVEVDRFGAAIGLSSNVVRELMQSLRRAGWEYEPCARAIEAVGLSQVTTETQQQKKANHDQP